MAPCFQKEDKCHCHHIFKSHFKESKVTFSKFHIIIKSSSSYTKGNWLTIYIFEVLTSKVFCRISKHQWMIRAAVRKMNFQMFSKQYFKRVHKIKFYKSHFKSSNNLKFCKSRLHMWTFKIKSNILQMPSSLQKVNIQIIEQFRDQNPCFNKVENVSNANSFRGERFQIDHHKFAPMFSIIHWI